MKQSSAYTQAHGRSLRLARASHGKEGVNDQQDRGPVDLPLCSRCMRRRWRSLRSARTGPTTSGRAAGRSRRPPDLRDLKTSSSGVGTRSREPPLRCPVQPRRSRTRTGSARRAEELSARRRDEPGTVRVRNGDERLTSEWTSHVAGMTAESPPPPTAEPPAVPGGLQISATGEDFIEGVGTRSREPPATMSSSAPTRRSRTRTGSSRGGPRSSLTFVRVSPPG